MKTSAWYLGAAVHCHRLGASISSNSNPNCVGLDPETRIDSSRSNNTRCLLENGRHRNKEGETTIHPQQNHVPFLQWPLWFWHVFSRERFPKDAKRATEGAAMCRVGCGPLWMVVHFRYGRTLDFRNECFRWNDFFRTIPDKTSRNRIRWVEFVTFK